MKSMNLKTQADIKKFVSDIWQKHESYIRKICHYKLNGMPEFIDDCVQDIFLDFLDAISKGKTIAKPGGWLAAVANNKIKDIYAQSKKDREKLVTFNPEKLDNIYLADVCEEAFKVDDEQIPLLKKKAMMYLNKDEKQLLVDKYTLKKSIAQIAKEHNTTENNIYQKLFRVKQKTKMAIKKMLQEEN